MVRGPQHEIWIDLGNEEEEMLDVTEMNDGTDEEYTPVSEPEVTLAIARTH